MAEERICKKCLTPKPIEEFYAIRGKRYRVWECRACVTARTTAIRIANPDRHKLYKAKYRSTHPDPNRISEDEWNRRKAARETPEAKADMARRSLESTRKWRLKNPDKVREQTRKWYAENRQWARDEAKRWYRENIERAKANAKTSHRLRRLRKFAAGGFHTESEWQSLCDKYGRKCLRCHRPESERKLTRDHIVPLCLPESSDNISNIQPLCAECNNSKRRKTVDYRPF